jgi:2-oxoglutarate dehydrogenase E2 component (dihydrolipoamide succinyltransferase)
MKGRGGAKPAGEQAGRGSGPRPRSRCRSSRALHAQAAPPPPSRSSEGGTRGAAGSLSPLVRKMAREMNLDSAQVKGTGRGRRITKQDVEAFAAGQSQPRAPCGPAPAPAAPAGARPRHPPRAGRCTAAAGRTGQDAHRADEHDAIKIAEHMVMSKRTSPHVTTIHRVDMTKVAKMRERTRRSSRRRTASRLTYLPFITRAAVAALRQYPLLNASLDNNNIIYHNEIHIGIAVALENGLIVPVIRGATRRTYSGLQRSIVDLAARARSRQLKPDEVTGGTFSITNFGSFGSLIGTPVINQPQVAIMGVGTVDKTPVVIDDAIAIRSICHLSLSFDHRLIDGALAISS